MKALTTPTSMQRRAGVWIRIGQKIAFAVLLSEEWRGLRRPMLCARIAETKRGLGELATGHCSNGLTPIGGALSIDSAPGGERTLSQLPREISQCQLDRAHSDDHVLCAPSPEVPFARTPKGFQVP